MSALLQKTKTQLKRWCDEVKTRARSPGPARHSAVSGLVSAFVAVCAETTSLQQHRTEGELADRPDCVSISGGATLLSVTLRIGVFYIKISSLTRSLFLVTGDLCVSICSSHLPFPSPSVFSSAFRLSHLSRFPHRSAHFSRTPFPPGSQATKYSDWCRQLGLITNGKHGRAAAGGCAVAPLQQTMNHTQAAEKPHGATHRRQGCRKR